MAAGKAAGFSVDGPRGPARVAQPGALWLAKTTGHPVLPVHFEADRHWTANSWDRTQIPKPFATVALVVGEPFDVVLLDALNPFGGGEVFPMGRMREPVQALARADAIVITRSEASDLGPAIEREVRQWNPRAPIYRSTELRKLNQAKAGSVPLSAI
jgi:hypothetical protein